MSDRGEGGGSGRDAPPANHKEHDEQAERQQREAASEHSRGDGDDRPGKEAATAKKQAESPFTRQSHDARLDDAMTLRRPNAEPSQATKAFFAQLNELRGDGHEPPVTLTRIGNPTDDEDRPDPFGGKYHAPGRDYGANALGPAIGAAHRPADGHHEGKHDDGYHQEGKVGGHHAGKAGSHHHGDKDGSLHPGGKEGGGHRRHEAGESDQAGRPHADQQPQGVLDERFAVTIHTEKPAEADDVGRVKISAEYKSGVESPGEPEKSIEAKLPLAEAKFNENVSIERHLGEHLNVQVAADMSGQAEIGARVGAEGVGVYAKAEASSGLQAKGQLDLGAAEVHGTAFLGLKGEAEAQASLGPRGVSAKVHEGAFAGASIGGETKLGNSDLSVSLGGRLSEGIGEQATAEAKLGWIESRLMVSADAALGLGLGASFDFRFSPRGLAHDIAHGAVHLADLIEGLSY